MKSYLNDMIEAMGRLLTLEKIPSRGKVIVAEVAFPTSSS